MRTLRGLVFAVVMIFLFWSLIRNILDYKEKVKFYEDYKNRYEYEKKQKLSLKTELLKKSSLYEIEKIIRNKLNLLKSEEVALILPQPTPTPTVISPVPVPNWKKWLDVYLNDEIFRRL